VLRISVISESNQSIHLQLHGSLVGLWVEELRRLGDGALSREQSVTLDLRGVRFADAQGLALLRELRQRQVRHLNCSQFVLQQMKEASK